MKTNLIIGALTAALLLCFFTFRDKNIEIKELEDELIELNTQRIELRQSLDIVKKKYATIENDLRNQNLIPATHISDWLGKHFSAISENMDVYREQFKIVLEQVRWYNETVQPYIEEYAGYINKAIQMSKYLPISLPYMHQVFHVVNKTLSYSEQLQKLTSDYWDFDLEMRKVDADYEIYKKNPNGRQVLLDMQKTLSGDYLKQLREFKVLLFDLEQVFEFTSESLRSIKAYKKTLNLTSTKLLGTISFWKNKKNKKKIGNLFKKKDSLDSLMAYIEKSSRKFAKSAAIIRKRMSSDIEAISVINAGVGILEASLPEK